MFSDQKTDEQKLSYCLGLDVAAHILHMPVKIDANAFLDAVSTMVKGERPDITQEEFQEQMQKFSDAMKQQDTQHKENIAQNKKAGDDFRAEYEKKAGVTKTASGLLIEVVTEGTGKTPKATDTVRVHYEGTLINGKVFDSSYARNEPAEFPLNAVIPGWTEGLQHAKEGGKLKLVIPPELAYGKSGAGAEIPPESTLIFTVELIKIINN